jgi:hypothetical protein
MTIGHGMAGSKPHGNRQYLTIAAAVVVAAVVIATTIFVSSTLRTTVTKTETATQTLTLYDNSLSTGTYPATPAGGPPFVILLNGSDTYPTYTVTAGQQVTLVVQIDASQPVSLNLSVNQQSGSAAHSGIVTNLSVQSVNAPTSGVLLHIDIGIDAAAGTYPMVVDAIENGVAGQVGFQAGFNLVVQQ